MTSEKPRNELPRATAARSGARRVRNRGRPPVPHQTVDRRDLILDAAEALFSVHGFHGVTVRDVADEAGVDPSLLSYYFGPKRELFDAVLLRRAEFVNAKRLLSMARYEAETETLTPEGCLQAFFEPVLELWETGGSGWKNYMRLIALVNNTSAWGGEAMTRYFDPVIQKLIELMRKALPDARDEDLYWSYHFVSGAISHAFAETGRIDILSGGLCRSGDVNAVRKRIAPFLASGFVELARRHRRSAT